MFAIEEIEPIPAGIVRNKEALYGFVRAPHRFEPVPEMWNAGAYVCMNGCGVTMYKHLEAGRYVNEYAVHDEESGWLRPPCVSWVGQTPVSLTHIEGPVLAVLAGPSPAYKEYREDGWPFCPQCGEDELWAHPTHTADFRPLGLGEGIANIVGCYRCSWAPPVVVVSGEQRNRTIEPKGDE